MITRAGLADEIDGFDVQIKAFNDAKSAAYKAYREQLEDAGMEPRRASAEVAATKAAIIKRRKLRENPDAAREKDDMIDAILVEIMERPSRAREASQSYAEAKGRESVEARQQFIDQSGGIGAALSAVLGVEVEMVRANPETGELTDTQEQPETATSSQHAGNTAKASVAGVSSAENDSDEISAPLSPSPANAPRLAADDEAAQANPTSSAPITNPQPLLLPGNADSASEAGTPPPASDATDFDPSKLTFLTETAHKTMADYRPNCQHPDNCAGSGLNECYACRKAAEVAA